MVIISHRSQQIIVHHEKSSKIHYNWWFKKDQWYCISIIYIDHMTLQINHHIISPPSKVYHSHGLGDSSQPRWRSFAGGDPSARAQAALGSSSDDGARPSERAVGPPCFHRKYGLMDYGLYKNHRVCRTPYVNKWRPSFSMVNLLTFDMIMGQKKLITFVH